MRFRAFGRQVLLSPASAPHHAQRLLAALSLEGREPAQGALADVFAACPPEVAREVWRACRAELALRLGEPVCRAFDRLAQAPREGAISPLATRWSVLCSPSMAGPRRVARCASDDSRALADSVMPLVLAGDTEVLAAFLDHCARSGDVLAFMLVRREWLKSGRTLDAAWPDAAALLERV